MGLFDSLFAPFSTKPAEDAAAARQTGLRNAQTAGTAGIDTGLNEFKNYYGQAGDTYSSLYAPLQAAAGKRTQTLDDATGVNGPEGLARARALFTANPGYTEGYDTGINDLERRAGARGMLGSGNTSADAIKYASDYANQKYGDYVSRLQPYLGQDIGVTSSLAGAQAGLLQGAGNKAYDAGALKGGIGYQTEQGIGNANADAAMAPYTAGKNMWDTILGLGKTAASLYPKGM